MLPSEVHPLPSKVMAPPTLSTAAQKLAVAQETDVRNVSESMVVSPHETPSVLVKAFPSVSTATQKVVGVLVHDTEVRP